MVVIDGVDEGLALASNLTSVLIADFRDQPVSQATNVEFPVEQN